MLSAFFYLGVDNKTIFIRYGLSDSYKHLLLAHKLCHIELNHISTIEVLSYNPIILIDEGREDEADKFALNFLHISVFCHKA